MATLDCDHEPSKQGLEALLETSAAPYAAYALAYHCDEPTRDAYMRQAIDALRERENHEQAAKLAALAGHMVLEDGNFAAALALAALAKEEEARRPHRVIRGRIHAVFAEVYDAIGMARAAQRHFEEAEELLAADPDEVANPYLKHGNYLLDLRTPETLERALHFYDRASDAVSQAIAMGKSRRVERVHLALALNRADALSQLGRLDEAALQLADLEDDELEPTEKDRKLLVTGYVAARRGDVAAAERAFRNAGASSESGDYRWLVELELARTYLDAEDLANAERSLRTAIDVVSGLRAGADQELRPWILARRNAAHHALFELLVSQERNAEALAMADTLSAQTWIEAAIAAPSNDEATQQEALLTGQLRVKMSSAAWLAAPVAAPAATHEALLYLEIEDRVWRGHVRGGEVTFERLPPETHELVGKFLKDPDNATDRRAASRALLPPELSTSGPPLNIIAYGLLADVPFAALEIHGSFLIQSRVVARIPSLAALRCRKRTWSDDVVVLGDARSDLPAATAEAQRLASAMGTTAALKRDATPAALFRAKNARLLHVATHGEQGEDGRALQLYGGEVTAADILEHGIAPEVAVLSGCATAASDAPESWNGFPSALLAAGSQYVIATLRSIEDRAAARIVSTFYAQPEGSPVARLAAAQRSLLGELPVREWSAFAAWGADECAADLAQLDPRPLSKQSP